MTNWIPDQNKFKLAGPPKWFLTRLWDFDSSLVIIPSRQDCVYRLAQRRKPNLSQNIVNDSLFKESDTKMMASYSLVPVTSIIATVNWSNPYIFQELANRAPHRQGGQDEVIKRIEAQEREEDLKKAMTEDERRTYLAKDGWNLYLKKLGLRSHMYSPKGKKGEVKPSSSPSIIIKP